MLKVRATSVRTFKDLECGSDFLFNDLVYIPRLGTGVISSVCGDLVDTSALSRIGEQTSAEAEQWPDAVGLLYLHTSWHPLP